MSGEVIYLVDDRTGLTMKSLSNQTCSARMKKFNFPSLCVFVVGIVSFPFFRAHLEHNKIIYFHSSLLLPFTSDWTQHEIAQKARERGISEKPAWFL